MSTKKYATAIKDIKQFRNFFGYGYDDYILIFPQSLLLGKAVVAKKFDINFRVQEDDGGLSSSFALPCLALQTPISLCAISAIMEQLQFRPQLVIILENF